MQTRRFTFINLNSILAERILVGEPASYTVTESRAYPDLDPMLPENGPSGYSRSDLRILLGGSMVVSWDVEESHPASDSPDAPIRMTLVNPKIEFGPASLIDYVDRLPDSAFTR